MGFWNGNLRRVMRLSEGLFDPRLDMRWVWKATDYQLWMGDMLIWHSNAPECNPSWDYVNQNWMASKLMEYINKPVADLKKRNLPFYSRRATGQGRWYYHDEKQGKNFDLLYSILLAADRRIGKNTTSIWLFTEGDLRVRNIIGHRI